MNLAEVANKFGPEADFHTGTDLAGLVDDSKSIENPVEFLIDIGGDGKNLDGIQHDFFRSKGEFERWTMDYYRGHYPMIHGNSHNTCRSSLQVIESRCFFVGGDITCRKSRMRSVSHGETISPSHHATVT